MNAPVPVLVLGGGFAGVYTALELQRHWPRRRLLQLTLVSRENHILFTPMLHEVAASDLDVTQIVSPIRKLLRTEAFFHGTVEGIDLATRAVTVRHVDGEHTHLLRKICVALDWALDLVFTKDLVQFRTERGVAIETGPVQPPAAAPAGSGVP